jgi:hypothetical protein
MTPRARLLRAAAGSRSCRRPSLSCAARVARLLAWRWGRGHGHEPAGLLAALVERDAVTWRATFARHAMISPDGFRAGETPWRAVQRAAW